MTEAPPGNIERRKNGDRRRNGKRLAPMLTWHRFLGLAAALFLVFLSITGVMLNHGPALNLDRHTTDSPLLLRWYGMGLEGDIESFRAGDHWVTWSDDHLFLDGRAVVERAARLLGVAETDGIIAAATQSDMFLLTPEGDLVERLTGTSLPGAVIQIGTTTDGQVMVGTDAGTFTAQADFVGWVKSSADTQWSTSGKSPSAIRHKVLVDYRGEGLPWSRVLLDLHSGRLFGTLGPLVMDATAVILVILAVTGLINWKRRR